MCVFVCVWAWGSAGGVCVLLCVTLTRLERQPCLSSSSCVTSTQHLQTNLKGPGLPVSLPTHPRTPPPRYSNQPDPPHSLLLPWASSKRIHAQCPSCILINVLAIDSSRQWPGCLAALLLTKPRFSPPPPPARLLGPVDTRTTVETNTGPQPLPVSSTYVTC